MPAVPGLAFEHPRSALVALVVAGCLLGLAATSRDRAGDGCRFEQTWYAGDQHYSERVEFRADDTGTWIESGFASDAPQRREEFRWTRTASSLTVWYGRERNRVAYEVERRGDTCYLTFEEHPFLTDRSGYLLFSDRE